MLGNGTAVHLYKYNGTTFTSEFNFTAQVGSFGTPVSTFLALYNGSLYTVTSVAGGGTKVLKSDGTTTSSWSVVVTDAVTKVGSSSFMVPTTS
jgi:hypothetical protein